MDLDRRGFLRLSGIVLARMMLPGAIARAASGKKPVILVVSGWQDVNIGDIGHTPGLLRVLKEFLPDAHVILWKKGGGKAVHALLRGHFPDVPVIYGKVETDGTVDSREVRDAFQEADLMIHGSGPSVVGQANLEAWVRATGKPFGIFGTTIQHVDENLKALLKKASFIFTRETASVEVLRKAGIEGKHVSFAPDATFHMNIRDEEKAGRFLKEHGLREKRFICAVPRLRITPYYRFTANDYTPERIREIEDLNNRCKEPDHAKLREAMVAWVRETGNRVLVCPEMEYQVDIMDELLIDPLPEDVKPFVVKRGFWFPDEAASVYDRAHTVLSFECHSPIIAAANGTPFFYLRQPEDTIKGQMYYDLGFEDWTFEIERTGGRQVADRLREVWTDYPGAQKKLKKGMDRIAAIYGERMKLIERLLVLQGT
jgi:polysaccharide pyruvyl transferase WcaK-like protein